MKTCKTWLFSSLLAVPVLLWGAAGIPDETCLQCHEAVGAEQYALSVHGQQRCVSCHEDVTVTPHVTPPKKPNCITCHPSEADACHACKNGEFGTTCADCHGDPHQVLSSGDPLSPTFRANSPQMCAGCHGDEQSMEKYNLLKTAPIKSYLDTVHGKALQKGNLSAAVCTDCHNHHHIGPPNDPTSKIFRLNIPSTCGQCHTGELEAYKKGIHGQAALAGRREAPVCTDCHGEHTIRARDDPESNLQPQRISEKICAQCHNAERIITKYHLPADRVQTYFDSYHGLANKYGVGSVANCASCHGAHGILPSTDPASTINKKNLPVTCGRCHPNVSDLLAQGSVHLAPSMQKNTIVYIVGVFYIFLIVIVIGAMALHNLLDFWRKYRDGVRGHPRGKGYCRFTLQERIQHGLLAITFALLAYTGFALRERGAWWTFPFTLIDVGFDWRGNAHKFLAILFCLLATYHLYTLFFTRRGRLQWTELMWRRRDLSDFGAVVKYNFGQTAERPRFPWYNYGEKAEYWGVIWGSFVMTLTGIFMTFESITMHYFPKWFLDVATTIHFYEAVLAVLSILVWHFYFVIFNPRCYPVNPSMFTGIDTEPPRLPSKLQPPGDE